MNESGGGDGVDAVPRRRDAIDAAARASTRLAREPRQFATASLHTGYDNKMNNQFWVCDFPRRSSPVVQQATPEAEVDDRDAADACLKERIGAVKGDALIKFAKGDRSRVDVRGLDSDSRKAVHRWAEWRGGLATESRGEAHERTLRLTRTKGSNRHAKVTFASSLRGFVTEMLKGDDAAATSVREEWDDILQRHDLDAVADGIVFIPCSSA